jgi:hypothetical protein
MPAIANLLPKLLPAIVIVVGLVAALVVQLGIAVEVLIRRIEPRSPLVRAMRVVNAAFAVGAFIVVLGAAAGAIYGARRIFVKPANMTVPDGYQPASSP